MLEVFFFVAFCFATSSYGRSRAPGLSSLPVLFEQHEHRPGLTDVLQSSQRGGEGAWAAVQKTPRLTPFLYANIFTTPSCGDRITVSIFIDSMLTPSLAN